MHEPGGGAALLIAIEEPHFVDGKVVGLQSVRRLVGRCGARFGAQKELLYKSHNIMKRYRYEKSKEAWRTAPLHVGGSFGTRVLNPGPLALVVVCVNSAYMCEHNTQTLRELAAG